MKKTIQPTLLTVCLLFLLLNVRAQGWEKKYSPDVMMGITSLYQTPNHGYITTGWDVNNGPIRIMKIDSAGNVSSYQDYSYYDSIQLNGPSVSNITQGGGYIIMGEQTRAMKINNLGQVVWHKQVYPGYISPDIGNADLDTTSNGGFICAINSYDTTLHDNQIVLTRLDSNGNNLWAKSYYDTSLLTGAYKYVYAVRNAGDGGFIACANLGSQQSIYKIDSAGNFLWQYIVPAPYPVIAHDGSILISGNDYIGKLTQNGQLLWLTQYAIPGSVGWSGNLVELNNNQYASLSEDSGASPPRYTFNKVDSAGHILLQNRISTAQLGANETLYDITFGKILVPASDGGYVTGFWIQNDPDNYSAAIIKMDSNGIIYPNQVSGIAYNDANNNCQQDSGEIGLKSMIISFTGRDTFQVATDANGYYWAELDTGSYTVTPTPLSAYWGSQSCNATQLNIPAPNTDTVINFPMQEIVTCPYITIDGFMFSVHTCVPGYYMMQYCNEGTAPLNGGLIEVQVDTLLVVDSASIPLVYSNGNQYYYQADTLGLFDCSTLTVHFNTLCNDSLGDRTACIYASVTPSTLCSPSPSWDESYLTMSVNCDPQLDSAVFTVTNTGTGNMNTPEKLIVIEDNVILNGIPVQLNQGAQLVLKQPANGSTYRATIPQTPYNPASIFATAAVEGCGVNQQGGISKGYILQYPINGAEAFEHTTCSEIGNPYDPNNKSAVPIGVNVDHLIDTTTQLEYSIEFQNTGSGTAYQVMVVDTLSPYLDPATIKLGLSSAKYNFQIVGNGILVFTFVNIDLADSGQSQLLSTGFLQFQIGQRANNPSGTVINNEAAIFFDYNAPVLTNNVFHTIGSVLVVSGIENLSSLQTLITAYPNPFSDKTTIKVDGEQFNRLQLTVYDLTGRKVKELQSENTNQFVLDSNGFSMGDYLFEIHSGQELIGRGKIAVIQ